MPADRSAMLREAVDDADRLLRLIDAVPANVWDQQRDGEWTPRQVVVHLADSELVFGYRLRTALATPGGPITPFDQDAWATNVPSGDVPIADLAATFAALRRHHAAILQHLPETSWQSTIQHPEYGVQTLERIAGVFLPHSQEHLLQLETMIGSR